MRTNVRKTVQLGELVVAAFDKAAQFTTDAQEISRLATRAVMRMLRRARGGHRFYRRHQQQDAPKRALSLLVTIESGP
jgi:hypothetical protein